MTALATPFSSASASPVAAACAVLQATARNNLRPHNLITDIALAQQQA